MSKNWLTLFVPESNSINSKDLDSSSSHIADETVESNSITHNIVSNNIPQSEQKINLSLKIRLI